MQVATLLRRSPVLMWLSPASDAQSIIAGVSAAGSIKLGQGAAADNKSSSESHLTCALRPQLHTARVSPSLTLLLAKL